LKTRLQCNADKKPPTNESAENQAIPINSSANDNNQIEGFQSKPYNNSQALNQDQQRRPSSPHARQPIIKQGMEDVKAAQEHLLSIFILQNAYKIPQNKNSSTKDQDLSKFDK